MFKLKSFLTKGREAYSTKKMRGGILESHITNCVEQKFPVMLCTHRRSFLEEVMSVKDATKLKGLKQALLGLMWPSMYGAPMQLDNRSVTLAVNFLKRIVDAAQSDVITLTVSERIQEQDGCPPLAVVIIYDGSDRIATFAPCHKQCNGIPFDIWKTLPAVVALSKVEVKKAQEEKEKEENARRKAAAEKKEEGKTKAKKKTKEGAKRLVRRRREV